MFNVGSFGGVGKHDGGAFDSGGVDSIRRDRSGHPSLAFREGVLALATSGVQDSPEGVEDVFSVGCDCVIGGRRC